MPASGSNAQDCINKDAIKKKEKSNDKCIVVVVEMAEGIAQQEREWLLDSVSSPRESLSTSPFILSRVFFF